ncbi:hypothetical protein KZ432_00890 [Glaesserella parasuis]|nr:hypothetical protein [Glaesserella parasuis]MCT8838253.1 hypothetical protein [Glaesserella parasuis]MCT8839931.1 hypothetical protein [Glaesserella parasuis]
MKVKCSACGAVHSLDALVANEAASQALNAALLINGELGRALISYLGLFRPAKSSLTFERVATILNELSPMITAGKIQRDGREFSAPPEVWIYGINQMLASRQTLKLPMKSHGYLLEIIASYKPVSTAVVVSDYGKSHTHSTSSKMNAVKGALEWATNG